MTEREFRKGIASAKRKLDKENYTQGVCIVLQDEFHPFEFISEAFFSSLFADVFGPRYRSGGYWLGSRFKMHSADDNGNLDKRELFLNMFEEYIVVNQYYLAA